MICNLWQGSPTPTALHNPPAASLTPDTCSIFLWRPETIANGHYNHQREGSMNIAQIFGKFFPDWLANLAAYQDNAR